MTLSRHLGRLTILAAIILSSLAAIAGEIRPTAMRELSTDMSGQLSGVLDKQGRPCALVKVNIPYEGAEFDGIVKVEARPGVYYVWIEDGNKMLQVYFPNCKPKMVAFGDFMTPAGVKAPRTYELDFDASALGFSDHDAPADLGKEFAVFTLSPKPEGAALLTAAGTTATFDENGQAMLLLPYGSYPFQVTADGFSPYSGNVTVSRGKPTELTVPLRSNRGTLTISCATPGSTIEVQGQQRSTSGSWSGKLPAGAYKVEVSKESYRTTTQVAELHEGETLNLDIPALTPITGSVAMQISPVGSTIKIDGREVGKTPTVLTDLLIGRHSLEITKEGYEPYTATLTIAEGTANAPVTASLEKKRSTQQNTTASRQNSNASSIDMFFPLENGFVLGKTTVDDMKRKGYEVEYKGDGYYVCHDPVLEFSYWDCNDDKVFEDINALYYHKLPSKWTSEIGLSFSLSYNKIMNLFKKLGYTIEVKKAPKTEYWDGRNTLEAEFTATAPDGHLVFAFSFSFGNDNGEGYSTDSKNSLYSIDITAK